MASYCWSLRAAAMIRPLRILIATWMLLFAFTGCEVPEGMRSRNDQQPVAQVNVEAHTKRRADKERRDTYLSQHPHVSPEVRAAISQGQLVIGMTYSEVCASLGKNYRVVYSNRDSYETSMMLEYFDRFVFFKNGRLSSWSGWKRYL